MILVLSLAGCDFGKGEPLRISAGLYDDPPRPIAAGRPFTVRAVGETDGAFEFAKVLVFRGAVDHDSDAGVVGDTLVAVDLNVTPGASAFDESVTLTVPSEVVSEAADGWICVEHGNAGCETGCIGASGTSIELVPAP